MSVLSNSLYFTWGALGPSRARSTGRTVLFLVLWEAVIDEMVIRKAITGNIITLAEIGYPGKEWQSRSFLHLACRRQ